MSTLCDRIVGTPLGTVPARFVPVGAAGSVRAAHAQVESMKAAEMIEVAIEVTRGGQNALLCMILPICLSLSCRAMANSAHDVLVLHGSTRKTQSIR